jgi:hypothetical protein
LLAPLLCLDYLWQWSLLHALGVFASPVVQKRRAFISRAALRDGSAMFSPCEYLPACLSVLNWDDYLSCSHRTCSLAFLSCSQSPRSRRDTRWGIHDKSLHWFVDERTLPQVLLYCRVIAESVRLRRHPLVYRACGPAVARALWPPEKYRLWKCHQQPSAFFALGLRNALTGRSQGLMFGSGRGERTNSRTGRARNIHLHGPFAFEKESGGGSFS